MMVLMISMMTLMSLQGLSRKSPFLFVKKILYKYWIKEINLWL
jgi:hypothetical protein